MISMNKKINKKFLGIIISILVCFMSACATSTLETFLSQLILPVTITEDLNLKSEYDFNGKNIKVQWFSTNENVISSTGKVTITNTEQQVILTCKATLGGKTLVKNFTMTVVADKTADILNEAALYVDMWALNSLDGKKIKEDVNLTAALEVSGYMVEVVWISSNESVFSNSGKVTLPKRNTIITLLAKIYLGDIFIERTYSFTVEKDPNFNEYISAEVYTGKIVGETSPLPVGKFDGAIYRKVISSKDYWLGIEYTVTLPEYHGDPNRMSKNPYGSNTDMRYNDNASVYMGASGNAESDVGLTWSMGLNPQTGKLDTSKSIGFRPFWRYIDSGKNTYANASVNDTHYYYYPGDKVKMSLYVTRPGYLQLRIELLEETTIPEYKAFRESFKLGDYNKVFLSAEFPSSGAGTSKILFKRCCALDQVGNEGGKSQPTNAQSLNIIFHEVYLYREVNDEVVKVPFTSDRRSELSWPGKVTDLGDFTNAIIVSYDGVDTSKGGEIVVIDPKNGK